MDDRTHTHPYPRTPTCSDGGANEGRFPGTKIATFLPLFNYKGIVCFFRSLIGVINVSFWVLVALFHTSLGSGACISYSLAFVSFFVILNDDSFNHLVIFFIELTNLDSEKEERYFFILLGLYKN